MNGRLLAYQSAAEPSRSMLAAMTLLASWILVTASCGLLVIVGALIQTYAPKEDTAYLNWLLLLLLWLPVVGGCAITGGCWWSLQQRRAGAVKNTLAAVRTMDEWWRYGYTLVGFAGALGTLSGLHTLNLTAMGLLLIWGALHLWLHGTRHLLVEAARDPEAPPAPVKAPPALQVPNGPATSYHARAERYLHAIPSWRTGVGPPTSDPPTQ